MNDRRKRAHSILVRTRDILADRLTERVLEDEQQILDDATGEDYMDDIGRLYESVGSKLGQVNLMIANLPINEEPEQKPGCGESDRTEVQHGLPIDTPVTAPGSPKGPYRRRGGRFPAAGRCGGRRSSSRRGGTMP